MSLNIVRCLLFAACISTSTARANPKLVSYPFNDAIPFDSDNRKADASIEFATYKCQEFYEERREAAFGVNTWYIGEGGQGVVHGCETLDPASTLKQIAVKVYKNPVLYFFEELEIKDRAMSDASIAIPLYGYYYDHSSTIKSSGKFEFLITDKENVDDHANEPAVYNEVAKALARVHSTPYSAAPISLKYNECGLTKPLVTWNTNYTYEHLTTGMGYGGLGLGLGVTWNPTVVALRLGIPESEMDNEFKWITEIVQEGAPDKMFFCHNDPHGGNMMIHVDDDGKADPSTYQLIDFDNAEFGFRAWDFEYYFSHIPIELTGEQIDEFLLSYLSVYNELNERKYTLEEIRSETEHHRPYVLMEQMLFVSNWYIIPQEWVDRYISIVAKLGHTLPTV